MHEERPGLRLKERPEDFRVEERLAFAPSGTGEHLYLFVEKTGLQTEELAARLALRFSVARRDVGYAGRKDRRAVTRQWFSVPTRTEPEAVDASGEGWAVLEAIRHGSKLRPGALAGNRFELVLRGETAPHRSSVESALGRLCGAGMPNRYGPQRFGADGESDAPALRLLSRDWRGFLLRLSRQPHWPPSDALEELREVLSREGREGHRGLGRLAPALPRELAPIPKQLARRRGDFEGAVRALDRRLVLFAVSALQARLFNRVLDARGTAFAEPWEGDLLQLHPGRSHFRVEQGDDLELLVRRAERGELSPTGPVFGWRSELARGRAGDLEAEVLAAAGLELEMFRSLARGVSPEGSRRSLRALVGDLEASWSPEELRLKFYLPPGAYATTLVEELGL